MKTKKLKEKDFVGYDEYLKNKGRMSRRIYDGWEFVYEKSRVKIITGAILFGLGVITLPLPTGSLLLIAIGLSLMSAGGIDLMLLKKTFYWHMITKIKMRRNR